MATQAASTKAQRSHLLQRDMRRPWWVLPPLLDVEGQRPAQIKAESSFHVDFSEKAVSIGYFLSRS